MCCEETGSGGFADSWVATYECSCRIDITTRVPPLRFFYFPLVTADVNVLPALQPLPQHLYLASLSYYLLQFQWLVFLTPQSPLCSHFRFLDVHGLLFLLDIAVFGPGDKAADGIAFNLVFVDEIVKRESSLFHKKVFN